MANYGRGYTEKNLRWRQLSWSHFRELLPVSRGALPEIGWFWGHLGRNRMMLLFRGDLEIPTDLQGIEFFR